MLMLALALAWEDEGGSVAGAARSAGVAVGEIAEEDNAAAGLTAEAWIGTGSIVACVADDASESSKLPGPVVPLVASA